MIYPLIVVFFFAGYGISAMVGDIADYFLLSHKAKFMERN